MSGGKDENVYQNVTRVSDHQQLGEGKPPEPSQKRAVIIQTVLLLLSLGLIASLVTMTVMYHQELKEKHQVAEAIQRMKDFLKHNNVSNASALEQNGLPLLVKLQLLMNALEEFNTSWAATRNQYSGFRTMISRGWRGNGENFYYLSQEKKSWEEAKQFCVSQNSHLTSILTQQEQDYLKSATKGINHWIGLSDLGKEGDWRWEDGTNYTERGFWCDKQPDDWNQGIGGSEDCVFINGPCSGRWNDANCTQKERWICKFAGQI